MNLTHTQRCIADWSEQMFDELVQLRQANVAQDTAGVLAALRELEQSLGAIRYELQRPAREQGDAA